jgi:urease accessory protein
MAAETLPRLLQLASPTLPVGAYSYSQGLEAALEAGRVTDAASAERWIGDVLELSVVPMEAQTLRAQIAAPSQALNDFFVASRETAELRAETLQMGHSLKKLIEELGLGTVPIDEPAYPTAYAFAVEKLNLDRRQALVAYLWSWLENHVMAAIKAVPLGQTAGQRILLSLGQRLEGIVDRAPSEEMRNFAPGLAALSARHENQYSRLFRS